MSLLSGIARNLIRRELKKRELTKPKSFFVESSETEIICVGDWRKTNAENFDIQLMSDLYGLCLNVFSYSHGEVQRSGGMTNAFINQNEALLSRRRNVIMAEEMRRREETDKILLRAMYQADMDGKTFLYDLSMVCFKRKQQYLWVMANGAPDRMWKNRDKIDAIITSLTCKAAEIPETNPASEEKSVALRVAEFFGFSYQILPPETSGDALMKIWKRAARPDAVPLLMVPNECFLELEELPVYPQPEEKGWPEAEAFLWRRIADLKESCENGEEDQTVWREVLDWDSGEERGTASLYADRSEVKAAGGFLLLWIPVEKSWDIFRKIPFGGWNECPSNVEIMAVSKYWRQKFGAVPIMLGRDTLQFYVKQPPKEEEIPGLALEMFGFCEDIVFQGTESVRELGKTIKNSNLWFFWWD